MAYFNPEALREFSDQNSKLGKLAEQSSGGMEKLQAPLDRPRPETTGNACRLPRSGEWDGEKGNSLWRPNREDVPSQANAEGKTWNEILDRNNIEGIPFKNGEPDFSDISKGNVEIDDFSKDRFAAGGNFDQADQKLAEQRGCTSKDVRKWREANKYTWHEQQDCKTMQKVPCDVHINTPHTGGVSMIKRQIAEA